MRRLAILWTVAMGLVLAAGGAAALPYGTGAFAFAAIDVDDPQAVIGGLPQPSGQQIFAESIDALGGPGGGPGGEEGQSRVAAAASADLATATLTAAVQADFLPPSENLIGFAGASMFDSFRAFDDSAPFSWDADDTARFDLAISGAAAEDLDTASHPIALRLSVGKAGSLDAGGAIAGPMLLGTCAWGFDRPSGALHLDGCDGILDGTADGQIGDPAGGPDTATATASFMPGADFDWRLDLSVATLLEAPFFGSSDIDLADSVLIGYLGPDGSMTRSASGLFPGTQALITAPEPSLALLFAGSVIGLALARRRFGIG